MQIYEKEPIAGLPDRSFICNKGLMTGKQFLFMHDSTGHDALATNGSANANPRSSGIPAIQARGQGLGTSPDTAIKADLIRL